MDYEKKYKEALERASRLRVQNPFDTVSQMMEHVFPELAESEDDRIRKELITHCRNIRCVTEEGAERIAKWIAWLEKQGKPDARYKHVEELLEADAIYQMAINNAMVEEAKNKAIGALSELEISKLLGLEKQGEQMSANKVEPKFKVGDWVVANTHTSYRTKIYAFLGNGTVEFEDGTFETEENLLKDYHLWTIQDAKDGDVLACENGWTCIFDCLNDNLFSSHCFVDSEGWFCEDGGQAHTLDNRIGGGEIHPATKKQRDLFFARIKEAGYDWDANKKELKKIEDENYDGEDYGIDSLFHAQRILEKTLGKVNGYQTDDGILAHKCAITVVNKIYKQKSAWSEEDENQCINTIELVKNANDCVGILDKETALNWLKSLKERYIWKPSDEIS